MSQPFTHLLTNVVFSTNDMINEVFNRALDVLSDELAAAAGPVLQARMAVVNEQELAGFLNDPPKELLPFFR